MTKKNLTIIDAFLQTQSQQEVHALLKSLLSEKEYEELPTRLEIFRLLHKKVPQHVIAKKLKVGIATVTRGSKEIQRGYIQKTTWWHHLSAQMGG